MSDEPKGPSPAWSDLIPFWIVTPSKFGPLGFGVTAFSLADALQIIESFGYVLPEDRNTLRVIERVKVSDLDSQYVVPKMGRSSSVEFGIRSQKSGYEFAFCELPFEHGRRADDV